MTDAPHYEQQYLDLMRHVWTAGDERVDRTGVGTRSVFGATLRFSLADNAIPLLTTKRVYWKTAAREMLWFLTGETNIRPLVEQGVHIWTDWPLDEYRRSTGEQRSEEHTSELQSLMRISYAVFCLKKKTKQIKTTHRD